MMWFIIGVLIAGTISIIVVMFPASSYVKLFEVLNYMYSTKKTKRKYRKELKRSDKPREI